MINRIKSWWDKKEEYDKMIIRRLVAYELLVIGFILTMIIFHLMSGYFLRGG